MMGSNDKQQDELFYAFNLDEMVPDDHLLRDIDRVLDLSNLREHLAPYYSHTGRPSVDPELMIRMLLIGYCCGIRSERQLCYEVSMNLAYRWFCKLKITDQVPHHSTFSKNRHGRFRDAETFRFVFEQVLQRCMDEGLIGGEGFAVDASVVKADASRQRHREDDDDDWGGGSRAINEYLDALKEDGSSIPVDKKISLTDPAAQWTCAPGGPAYYAYSTNYLVDTDNGIIVDVEATPALRTPEVWSTKTMIERVKGRFGVETKKLIGDTAYGTAEFLNWMVNEANIEPHVPVWDRGEGKDGMLSRSDFAYDVETDSYTCPNGKQLLKSRRNYKVPRPIPKNGFINYRASKLDCMACPLKEQCCPKAPAKKLLRSVHESARDVAREVRKTPAYRRTRRQRKQVEMLFAHMKRILKMDRLRLRGISGARDEFLLTATAQNLRRMAKYLGTGPPKISEMEVT
jgi:transposase